jgi:hypothetical protein
MNHLRKFSFLGTLNDIKATGGQMKRLLVAAALSCLALQGQNLSWSKAQGYVGGGFTQSMGGFGQRHDTGWGVLAGGGVRVSSAVSLNLEYSFNKFDYNYTTYVPTSVSLTTYHGGTEVHGYTFNPRIHTHPLGKVGTYFTGGYGVYNPKFQLARPLPSSANIYCGDPYWNQCTTGATVPTGWALGQTSTWKGGWNAGFGIEGGGRVKFFADARYVYIFTHNIRTEFIPVTFGIHF